MRNKIIVGLVIGLLALTALVLAQCRAKPHPHTVTLSWHPPTAAKGVKVTGYNVLRSTTSGSSYVRIASGVHDPSYIDKHVDSGTTYFYVVTAVDDIGRESKYSNEVKASIPVANR